MAVRNRIGVGGLGGPVQVREKSRTVTAGSAVPVAFQGLGYRHAGVGMPTKSIYIYYLFTFIIYCFLLQLFLFKSFDSFVISIFNICICNIDIHISFKFV